MIELPSGLIARVTHFRLKKEELPEPGPEYDSPAWKRFRVKKNLGLLHSEAELRAEGYPLAIVSPHGGATRVMIMREKDTKVEGEDNFDLVLEHWSYCNLKDTFNKTIARDVAVGRALKLLKEAQVI